MLTRGSAAVGTEAVEGGATSFPGPVVSRAVVRVSTTCVVPPSPSAIRLVDVPVVLATSSSAASGAGTDSSNAAAAFPAVDCTPSRLSPPSPSLSQPPSPTSATRQGDSTTPDAAAVVNVGVVAGAVAGATEGAGAATVAEAAAAAAEGMPTPLDRARPDPRAVSATKARGEQTLRFHAQKTEQKNERKTGNKKGSREKQRRESEVDGTRGWKTVLLRSCVM